MSPRRRLPGILPADIAVRVAPVWAAGRYAIRLTVGLREPVDLSLEVAARLVADLAAAVRLAQHHADTTRARLGGGAPR